MKERKFVLDIQFLNKESLLLNFHNNMGPQFILKIKINYLTKKKNLSQYLIKYQVFGLNVHHLKWTKSYLRNLNLKPQLKNYELA